VVRSASAGIAIDAPPRNNNALASFLMQRC
jgi:hypothetical protein